MEIVYLATAIIASVVASAATVFGSGTWLMSKFTEPLRIMCDIMDKRVSYLEANHVSKADLHRVERAIDRIDSKLDRLIELRQNEQSSR